MNEILRKASACFAMAELVFECDAVLAITRYDGSQQADLLAFMHAWIGLAMALRLQEFTALIGQSGEQVNDIYQADCRDYNRENYMRGRKTFYATWAEFKKLLHGIWRRDELGKDGPRGEPRMFRARNICRITLHNLRCGAFAKSSPRGGRACPRRRCLVAERRRLNPCLLAAPVAATPLPSGKALLHPALAAAPSPSRVWREKAMPRPRCKRSAPHGPCPGRRVNRAGFAGG